jgi:hypothetical protein
MHYSWRFENVMIDDCNREIRKRNAGFLGINEAHFHYMNVDFANATAAEC